MSWFSITHIILSTWCPFRETKSNSLKEEKKSSLSPRTLTRVLPSCLLSLAASLDSSWLLGEQREPGVSKLEAGT